jgi:hypothetical protein
MARSQGVRARQLLTDKAAFQPGRISALPRLATRMLRGPSIT